MFLFVCRAPAIASYTSTSDTSGFLVINPPNVTQIVLDYQVTATPLGQSNQSLVLTFTCNSALNCPLTGLSPGTQYNVSVSAQLGASTGNSKGTLGEGGLSPPSTGVFLGTATVGAPTLTGVFATGATAAVASGTAPTIGGPWVTYTFTAAVVGGSGSVVCVNQAPTCGFTGLAGGATYSVTIVASTISSTNSVQSNAIIFTTPSPRWAAAVSQPWRQRPCAALLGCTPCALPCSRLSTAPAQGCRAFCSAQHLQTRLFIPAC